MHEIWMNSPYISLLWAFRGSKTLAFLLHKQCDDCDKNYERLNHLKARRRTKLEDPIRILSALDTIFTDKFWVFRKNIKPDANAAETQVFLSQYSHCFFFLDQIEDIKNKLYKSLIWTFTIFHTAGGGALWWFPI